MGRQCGVVLCPAQHGDGVGGGPLGDRRGVTGVIPVGAVRVHGQAADADECGCDDQAGEPAFQRGHDVTSSSGENWKSLRWLRCMIQIGYGSMWMPWSFPV